MSVPHVKVVSEKFKGVSEFYSIKAIIKVDISFEDI